MASMSLESVIVAGETVLRAKRYIVASHFMWFWDYALTFSDEVNYAWKGKKSWAFGLFILNRYPTLLYIIWAFVASWWPGYSQKMCDKTAFIETMFFCTATLFAQTTLTLRVYVVTGKNKILTALLVCISLAQFIFGIYTWVHLAQGQAIRWPPIPLDSFQLCFLHGKRYQEIGLMTFSLTYDLLAFLIVVWVARRPGSLGRSKLPTILNRIVKDATVYFMVIFTSHLVVEFFILFVPPAYRLLPINSNAILIPVMASRLMLSLKKAADTAGSFTCTEDLDVVSGVMFRDCHTTMECAMGTDISRHDDRDVALSQDGINLELVRARGRR